MATRGWTPTTCTTSRGTNGGGPGRGTETAGWRPLSRRWRAKLQHVWQAGVLTHLLLVTRLVMPAWIGVGTWVWLRDGRWQWGALGAMATGLLAAVAWRTVRLWLDERRPTIPPTEQLVVLMRLRSSRWPASSGQPSWEDGPAEDGAGGAARRPGA